MMPYKRCSWKLLWDLEWQGGVRGTKFIPRMRKCHSVFQSIIFFWLIFLLKYSWFTILYQFLMYVKVTQIYIAFLISSFIKVYHKKLDIRTSLLIQSKWNSLHLLTPKSLSIPFPSLSSLATICPFSMSMSLFLLCRWVPLCHVLGSTYKW